MVSWKASQDDVLRRIRLAMLNTVGRSRTVGLRSEPLPGYKTSATLEQ